MLTVGALGAVESVVLVSFADGPVLPAGSVICAATVRVPSAGTSAAGTLMVTTPAVISAALSVTLTSGVLSPSVSTSSVSPAAASVGRVISAVTPAAISAALSRLSPPSLMLTVGALGAVESITSSSVVVSELLKFTASVTTAVISYGPSASGVKVPVSGTATPVSILQFPEESTGTLL